MRPAGILSSLAAFSILAAPVLAQGNGGQDDNSPAPTDTASDSSPSPSSPSPSPTNNDRPSPTASPSPTKESSSSSKTSSSSSSSSPSSTSISSSKSSSTTSTSSHSTSTPPIPTLTSASSSSSANNDIPTGLPTLTGKFGVPTYPPAAVPPTENAPFMRQSSAPDGTVFIAVGAILGAFGVAILLWRSIVSFLLHRSVRRAAMAQHDANVSKAGFPAPPAPFYKYSDHSSPAPVGAVASGRSTRRTSRAPGVPSAALSTTNLFFSPTATASNNLGAAGARGSAFLPSGFYAAGNSTPGGQGPSISMTNLRPESISHGSAPKTTVGQTPPDSPRAAPRRDLSSSTTGNRLPGQRAPSAYLNDLLADDPGSLPPPQMPSSHNSSRNSGRF